MSDVSNSPLPPIIESVPIVNVIKKQKGFAKGVSGNPKGKIKGTKNLVTRAAEAMLDGEADKLTRKAIEMALSGDSFALRLCLERIIPPRKDRPLNFPLPAIGSAADAALLMGSLLQAVADGKITPFEASEVTKLVDSYCHTLETAEYEGRLAALEAAAAGARQ